MKYSDAQKEATARYNKKKYDRINVVNDLGEPVSHDYDIDIMADNKIHRFISELFRMLESESCSESQ